MKPIIGCLARFTLNPYEYDVEFARKNGFDLLQIYYDKAGLFSRDTNSQLEIIKDAGFPGIVHALLDINEIREHSPKLIDIAKRLGHKEVIIHPICRSEAINDDTIYKLCEIVEHALNMFLSEGITLYLENNSKLDPIFTTAREIGIMFEKNPRLEFLLDVAHIYDYNHLMEMVKIKMPKILHITDSHMEVIHEHVPIGQGNIDFEHIFRDLLPDFDGKVIFEIHSSDEDIVYAKKYIEGLLIK